MILAFAGKGRKTIAIIWLMLLYIQVVLPNYALGARRTTNYRVPVIAASGNVHVGMAKRPLIAVTPTATPERKNAPGKTEIAVEDMGGPGQPESRAFHPADNANMVDLFTGDFSYSIPLMDVGGYPITIGYNSGITMDEEASWVGLGWNLNPGAITRNMRGLPDDFNGTDSIQKTMNIKESKTVGVSVGAEFEVVGLPLDKLKTKAISGSLGGGLGVFHNSYRGWGLEASLDATINLGARGQGPLSAGLSLTNNSQEGISLSPSLSFKTNAEIQEELGGFSGSLALGTSYNSRSGMKALQLSSSVNMPARKLWGKSLGLWDHSGSLISFAYPSYTPGISIPYTNSMLSVTLKVGGELGVVSPSVSVTGNVSSQFIAEADRHQSLPAYGYLNYQNNTNPSALLDYNREKEIPYREKPAVPNIAVPSYTYDVFSISGEGTGGMFRAYRGDIGYVYDHYMKTKGESDRMSVDLGLGNLVHGGVDLNFVDASTESGPWQSENPLASTIAFKKSDKLFEAAYFRNPAETAVNTKSFYDAIGGDDVVAVDLYQPDNSSSTLSTTNYLNRYRNKSLADRIQLNKATAFKTARDKRTQVISYFTAKEASEIGLAKYIDSYTPNTFGLHGCVEAFPDETTAPGTGLRGDYFKGVVKRPKLFQTRIDKEWKRTIIDSTINFKRTEDLVRDMDLGEIYFVTWTGRLKADITGPYTITTDSDDGTQLFLNGQQMTNRWYVQGEGEETMGHTSVNLVAGQMYDIRLEYFQYKKKAAVRLYWEYPSHSRRIIPQEFLYPPAVKDTFLAGEGINVETGEPATLISREKRVNSFRKDNHLSEIDVLNADGRRYIYGLPVYNLKQKEVSFSVDAAGGNLKDGLVKYTQGQDDDTTNRKGQDWYFNGEEVPAYAHSFLLTGILSPDYSDLTGDGISDDDLGDAVKFNYSKVAGINNPYGWRAPYTDSAGYSEGLRTDNRDDKGNYVYGEKELWYLHSIESKNMIATFKVGTREDLLAINKNGSKQAGPAKKLEEINLYTKADFMQHGLKARPVKTVHFSYSYRLCRGINGAVNDSGKLTLDSIWFSYNDNGDKGRRNPYVFHYNKTNPTYNIKSYDRWGNYKDPLQNPGSTADNLITNAEYPYALQDSAIVATNAAAWTLDTIDQPAGGRMRIIYEGDDYAYVQNKRAAQLFKIAGFSSAKPTQLSDLTSKLYSQHIEDVKDHLYVGIKVPRAVHDDKEVFKWYLEGLLNTYFKLFVKMPADKWGNGSEYVPCYGKIDYGPDAYGFIDNNTIWIKLAGIEDDGTDGGPYSPLAKAAIQFLRLNLPSKAYPGSDVGDDISLGSLVQVVLGMTGSIMSMFSSFDHVARSNSWASDVDLNRSYIRLYNPFFKKYGGGLRVKRIETSDHWNNMTGQKESVYGQEYEYTTTKIVNGVEETISSGVAAYEPIMGGEENSWRTPIQYKEQVAALAPVTVGYTEEPLGESFFPAPVVGYSKVRVRSINAKNTRSANGYEEARFFTAYDFPTIVERTELADEKKRYKPALANFLHIDAKHFLAVSQGFKVELNDMHGKLRSQATYGEADPNNYITYTENFYHVDDLNAEFKHLNNTANVVTDFNGSIPIVDSTASIGRDIELMVDMREQRSLTNAFNVEINTDMFSVGIFPFLIPSLLNLLQRDETKFRSVAITKVINRHGIIDSVRVIDKGSRVTTANVLYDGETGQPLCTSTQNEFNDPIYHSIYPAAWAYDGMRGAYRNIGLTMDHVYMKEGRIIQGLPAGMTAGFFASGDELLIWSKPKTYGPDCNPDIATWPTSGKIWALDANMMNETGIIDIYFIDSNGVPFSGNDISLKVIRSGRRNIMANINEVSGLNSPLGILGTGPAASFVFLPTTIGSGPGSRRFNAINANVTEFKQFWKAEDQKKMGLVTDCIPSPYNTADCLIPTFVNHPFSKTFTPVCPEGGTADPVVYPVAEGIYTSTISQDDADTKALADANANGQAYANAYGVCVYKNKPASQSFNRQCPDGSTGSAVLYQVPEGKYTSTINQDDADAKAQADIAANGQDYANDNGNCGPPRRVTVKGRLAGDTPDAFGTFGIRIISALTGQEIPYTAYPPFDHVGGSLPSNLSFDLQPNESYHVAVFSQNGIYAIVAGEERFCKDEVVFPSFFPTEVILSLTEATVGNDEISTFIAKNDCTGELVGSSVKYTVPANTVFRIGKDAANAAAWDIINNNGQDFANENGVCMVPNSLTVRGKPNAPTANNPFHVKITDALTQTVIFDHEFDGTPFPDFQEVFTNGLPAGSYTIAVSAKIDDLVVNVNSVEKSIQSGMTQTWSISTGPIVIEVAKEQ